MQIQRHLIAEIMRPEHLQSPFGARIRVNRTFTFGLLTVCFLSCNFVFACGPGRVSNERRDFPDFQQNERGPDVNEENVIASGSFIKAITRSSKEFKTDLVRSFDTGIIFKDDEKTGADRYMTRRCKNALETLARHVIVEWDGRVKLRVIEAWDEDGQHAPRALHYEGRAIDITTSDRDKKRYGKLASLAFYKANFDWVTFLGSHVHVSCRRGEPEDGGGRCFPADGTVTLQDGTTKRMDQLSIGDKVLSQSESGRLVFSDVIMFMDKQTSIYDNNYVVIETDEPFTRITLSRQHLIFVAKNKNSTLLPTFASNVRSGHFVKVVRPNSTGLILARVRRVGVESKLGAYAPLTIEGTIVVNNVLASCYALIKEQTFAHTVFSPWRFTYNLIGEYLHRSSKSQRGLHWYPVLLKTINRIIGLYPAL